MNADTDVQDSEQLAAAVRAFNETVGERVLSLRLPEDSYVTFKEGMWQTEQFLRRTTSKWWTKATASY